MTRMAVLLRGVNVGRNNRIGMADLRSLLADLGGREVSTYLQSGNAVLDADQDPDGLAAEVESGLAERFALNVRVLVRTGAELAAVVAANPFPEQVSRPKQLHVAFLAEQPDPALVQQVGRRHGADELAIGDRAIYLCFGQPSTNDSPLNGALRRIGGVTTARNWTTVLALRDLTGESG